ncbi:MAG: hypothetical protein ACE5GO_08400, partial [Anaerolineales bacterium]
MFDLIDNSELNGIVVDVKLDAAGDVGRIAYRSKLPVVQELNTSIDYIDVQIMFWTLDWFNL